MDGIDLKQQNNARHLLEVLCVYCNTPHEAIVEKTYYLVFGLDCRSPEAAMLPPTIIDTIRNYSMPTLLMPL